MNNAVSVTGRFLIPALSAGNFAIGMGAFVVIGILSPIRESFGITTPDAGWIMTVYAIAYTIGSPLGVALTGRWPRRTVLMTGMAMFAVAALLSAMAPSLTALLPVRVLAAFGAGIFTPVSAGVAIACSQPGRQGRSLANVFFGLTLAQVMGVPVGSFVGYTFGWPVAFVVVALLAVVCMVLIAREVPANLDFQVNTLSTLGKALMDWRSLFSVSFTASFLAAIYVLYTYLGPLLEAEMGYGRNGITILLLSFGIGAVMGNFLGGRLADRFGPYRTLMMLCLVQMAAMSIYSFLPLADVTLLIVTLVWSVFGWSFMVAQQSRLVAQTPSRQNVVLALNAAAVYLGVAIGSAIGAGVIDRSGLTALGLTAASAMILALIHLIFSERCPPTSG